MKAWLLNDIDNYKLENVARPMITNEQVMVKVNACGICGSDIPRVYQNGAHKMPLIIGHEFSGEVVEVPILPEVHNGDEGIENYDYSIGDRVGIFPLIPCMKCRPCLEKKYEMCRHYSYLGSRRDGGFAEYAAVPKWNLIKLPDNVSFEAAAMLEPMAVAVHAIRRVLPIGNDNLSDLEVGHSHSIAIYGLGTIGTLIALFLKDAGYTNIYAIGNKDFQRDTWTKMGFEETYFCDSRNVDVSSWILNKTGGNGADVFFECIGKNETIEKTVDLTAPGGKVCLVGNPFSDINLDKQVYWKILRNQINVTGTWNSSFAHEENDDWNYVLKRLSVESINPSELITHRLTMDDLEKGFHLMRDKTEDYIKVMMINE